MEIIVFPLLPMYNKENEMEVVLYETEAPDPNRKEILSAVSHARRFPIVRFELRSSQEPDLRSIALNHVYITRPDDSMELVKERSAALESLRKKGWIKISYSLPAYVQSDYKIYYQSQLYELLCHTVMEAREKKAFCLIFPPCGSGRYSF